jgi:hypothetical protein
MSEPNDFVASITAFLVPEAQRVGFSDPIWIPRGREEMLAIFRGNPFDLLVYCAAGHGVNMSVTVAPTSGAKRNWNPSDELGLGWLSRALGLVPWKSERYRSSAERETDIQELARRLSEFVSAASARGDTLWSDIRESVRASHRQGT